MAITKEFRELAQHAARRTAPANFTVGDINETFKKELEQYCGSIPQFMKHRWDLYEIIMENADEIVPVNVEKAIGMFAEVRTVKQGQKAMFRTSNLNSKLRARKFLTQVGLSGVYESFRLDVDTFEVRAQATGGAVSISWERLLDGHENMAEVMEVMIDAQISSVFIELQKALVALATSTDVPAANRKAESAFDSAAFFSLCNIAKAYSGGIMPGSGGAVIFAPPEFIAGMGPDAIVAGINNAQHPIYPQDDIDSIHKTGYINLFRGIPIVPMPQSFTTPDNDKRMINPQVAYILPAGKEKIAKIVFEGGMQMYDWQNADNSMEMHMYRKFGVAITAFNHICIYKNAAITDTLDPAYA